MKQANIEAMWKIPPEAFTSSDVHAGLKDGIVCKHQTEFMDQTTGRQFVACKKVDAAGNRISNLVVDPIDECVRPITDHKIIAVRLIRVCVSHCAGCFIKHIVTEGY